jgi:hypothetical protein
MVAICAPRHACDNLDASQGHFTFLLLLAQRFQLAITVNHIWTHCTTTHIIHVLRLYCRCLDLCRLRCQSVQLPDVVIRGYELSIMTILMRQLNEELQQDVMILTLYS